MSSPYTDISGPCAADQDEDDEILSGMMSPPSGYSSGDEGTPYANADILSAVKQEVEKLKNAHNTAAAGVAVCL